jgi:hypothetical protein
MDALYFILALLAAICFAIAASGRAVSRVNVLALGLLLWVCIPLIQYGRLVF